MFPFASTRSAEKPHICIFRIEWVMLKYMSADIDMFNKILAIVNKDHTSIKNVNLWDIARKNNANNNSSVVDLKQKVIDVTNNVK